jgi:hypothetical protein
MSANTRESKDRSDTYHTSVEMHIGEAKKACRHIASWVGKINYDLISSLIFFERLCIISINWPIHHLYLKILGRVLLGLDH